MGDDLDASLKTLAKGVGIMYIGTFISKVLMYLYRIVIAREDIGLGPEAYGLLSLGLAVFWVSVSLSNLGLGRGIVRHATDYMGRDEEDQIPTVMAAAFTLTVPFSLLIAALVFILADPLAVRFFNNSELVPVIRIFSLAVPFQILYSNLEGLVTAFRDMKYIAITDKLFRSLFTFIGTVVLIYAGYGVMGAVVAQLGAVALSSLLLLWFAQRNVYPFIQRKYAGLQEERQALLSYSWPLFLSGIVGLLVGWTDTILLGVFDTSSNVGIYNAALPTAKLLMVVSTQMVPVLFPTVSEWYSRGDKQIAERIAAVSLKWMYLITFPGLLLMVLFRRQILGLLFGNTYMAGGTALAVLAVAFFTKTMTAHAGPFINSEEYTRLQLLNSVVIATMNVVLNLLLIPQYSTTGAAAATAFSLAFGGILATAEAYYFFDIQPYRISLFLPATLAAVAAAGAIYTLLHTIYNAVPQWTLLPGLIAFGILYAAFFFLFGGVSEHDLEILRAIDEKTPADLEPVKKIIRKLMR